MVTCLTARIDRARGWPEGDILIMGIVHLDRAAHTRSVCQLSATTQEDSGNTRDSDLNICRWDSYCSHRLGRRLSTEHV